LVGKLVAGPTRPAPDWVATLDHEVRDDAVEDGAVVKGHAALRLTRRGVHPLLLTGRQADEVLHSVRGALLLEAYDEVPHRGVEAGVELPLSGDVDGGKRSGRAGHGENPPSSSRARVARE